MALLWMKQSGGTRYEVRSAGRTRRLYTNGVFHSQYNAARPVTGAVWDLLFLPAFFYPRGRIRRVLVLGVGGGAVIRQLQQFVMPERIVGVELDPVHLEVARAWFGVGGDGVSLQRAEALDWLEAYDGPGFDLVIDDMYGECGGEPQRAFMAERWWFGTLMRRVAPGGALVMNFVDRDEFKRCAYFHEPEVAAGFASAFELTTPRYQNVVGAFLGSPADSAGLRGRLQRIPALDPLKKSTGLRYRVRRLRGVAGDE